MKNSISILVIEDKIGDQKLLEAHLSNTNLNISKITFATTIAEAINYLKQETFSLIFLDFYLPDSSGLQSYTEIYKINEKIPIIILSGFAATDLSIKAISLGAQDFILKGSYNTQILEKSVWYSLERKKNIELLKDNNERYDLISIATNDIIWDWNIDTDCVKWLGQGLEKYLPPNHLPQEIPVNFWANGLHVTEKKDVLDSLFKVLLQDGNSWERDFRFLRNDGTYAHIYSRGHVIRNDEGKAVRMIGSMQDITDRKNAELETQKARLEAEEARKTQEQFLANMSHEIRTPMNGVIGMTQLLAGTELTSLQHEFVNTINESASNLMVIINDILDLTKIVAGKITLINTNYIFSDVIEKSIKINQFRADEKGILITKQIDKNIPPVLFGDHGILNQIMINLVGNAIKFTEKGEVKILVQLMEETALSVKLEFAVADTGIGIAEDKVDSIFERFMQGSGTSTRKYGGSGLGLTISRQLIELQGGNINVKSKQGKGSIFTFYLTIKKGELPKQLEKVAVKNTQPHNLNNLNILLVEDNIINQKVATKSLNNMGVIVNIANNGKEAIEYLKTNKCDIILMDIQMPEMDGYEATQIIRQQMELKDLPIIAMTAAASIADKEKCITAGMNDYIAKPFQTTDLYEKIAVQLARLGTLKSAV